jgi:hypothetical protein
LLLLQGIHFDGVSAHVDGAKECDVFWHWWDYTFKKISESFAMRPVGKTLEISHANYREVLLLSFAGRL